MVKTLLWRENDAMLEIKAIKRKIFKTVSDACSNLVRVFAMTTGK